MRPKSILLLALALGCGLVASIGISQVMDRKASQQGEQAVETEDIYVALKDINLNEPLTPELLKLEAWPKVKIPVDAMRNLEELVGQRPGTKLFEGEPIRRGRLISANDAASNQLPKGYRPFPVRVSAETSAAGLIKPGDRVDVQLFVKRNPSVGIEETKTQTILNDVRVFAVDQHFRRASDSEEAHVVASTISLVVTVDQANKLSLATRIGEMSLLLRHPDDKEVTQGSADISELFGVDNADREKERTSANDEDVLKQLEAMKRNPIRNSTDAQPAPVEEPVPSVFETHKLVVLRGSEVEVVEFSEEGVPPGSHVKTSAEPKSGNASDDSSDSPLETPDLDDDADEPHAAGDIEEDLKETAEALGGEE